MFLSLNDMTIFKPSSLHFFLFYVYLDTSKQIRD